MSGEATTSPSGTVGGEALSFEGGVEAIESLLSDDPETDLESSEETKGSEVEPDDGEPELSLDDDEDGQAAEAEDKAPSLTDDTEIVLEDGEKITLAQLKRNNLFQRDYSRKTEELARQRESYEKELHERVTQASEDIRRQREAILEYSQQFLPQEPDVEMLRSDPLGYMEAKAVYDQQMQALTRLSQQREHETRQLTEQQQKQAAEYVESERTKLFDALPKLKDPEKLKAFRTDAVSIGEKVYGVPEQDINTIADSRWMRILHDAISYQKLVAKKASTQETVKAKPKLVNRQRMSLPESRDRDAAGRFQALKKTGSVDDAIRSIMDTL